MPNKNYIKGYRFERRVKKHLEEQGYVVFRQGKSAFPDLIGLRKRDLSEIPRFEIHRQLILDWLPEVILVECKVNEKDISKSELEALKKLREDTNATSFLAYREKRKIVMRKIQSDSEKKKQQKVRTPQDYAKEMLYNHYKRLGYKKIEVYIGKDGIKFREVPEEEW